MAGPTLTLEQVRGMLPVHKHRLDDELELQPDMYERISTIVTVKNSRMLEAKEELARVEGRLLEDIRDADAKITVDAANARVRRSPERVRAWEASQHARAELEAWQGALEAWKQKGYSIKTLADLYAAQYFSVTPTNITSRQRDRMEDGDERRAAMRKAGHVERRSDPTEGTRSRRDEDQQELLPRRGSGS